MSVSGCSFYKYRQREHRLHQELSDSKHFFIHQFLMTFASRLRNGTSRIRFHEIGLFFVWKGDLEGTYEGFMTGREEEE